VEVSLVWQFVVSFWGDKGYVICVIVADSDESDPSLSSEIPSSSSLLPCMLFRECAVLQANKSLIGEQLMSTILIKNTSQSLLSNK